jgi:hypothetical protein
MQGFVTGGATASLPADSESSYSSGLLGGGIEEEWERSYTNINNHHGHAQCSTEPSDSNDNAS